MVFSIKEAVNETRFDELLTSEIWPRFFTHALGPDLRSQLVLAHICHVTPLGETILPHSGVDTPTIFILIT